MGFIGILIGLTFLATVSLANQKFRDGAPCRMQHTMKADRKEHGIPQDGDPPFDFTVRDQNGQIVSYYEPRKHYTVEIVGRTRFRGLLLQPRLATRNGFIIGHLRGGRFLPGKTWENYGIKIQNCQPVDNDSITHANLKRKFLIRAKWTTSRFVGPVQFYMTVFKDKNTYYERWQPISGFLLPKPRFQPGRKVEKKEEEKKVEVTEAPKVTVTKKPKVKSTTAKPKKVEEKVVRPEKKRPGDLREKVQEASKPELVVFTESPEYYEYTDEYYYEDEYAATEPPQPQRVELKTKIVEVPAQPPPDPVRPQTPPAPTRPRPRPRPRPQTPPPAPVTEPPTTVPTTTEKIDYCDPNPCFNGGSCVNIEEEDEDYATVVRKKRQKVFDSGEGDSVEEESIVDDGDAKFYCQCPKGFTGATCVDTDHCADHKCRNGVCKNEKSSYTCECYDGFAGKYCGRDCPGYLCEQGGTCMIDDEGEYGCFCVPGTTGKRCELEVDECASNPCLNGGTCIDKFNKYLCKCDSGYMGKTCHRACQDIYKTCDLWRRQDHCVVSRHTTFFDINCPRSCNKCEYRNDTIKTEVPMPPVLEPLEFLIGVWESNVTTNLKFPFDFTPEDSTYYETLKFIVTKPPMFGTPFLNYSSVAINNDDPDDIQITRGFFTLRTRPRNPRRIGLMTTGNYGVSTIEEGNMGEKAIKFSPQYVTIHSEVGKELAKEVEREYKLDGAFLREKITKVYSDGQRKEAYKYFYRTKYYDIY